MMAIAISLANTFTYRPMNKRLNRNHQKPCACFECDKYPKRPRYTEEEWKKTYPAAEKNCRFCGLTARSHASSWKYGDIFVGGACPMRSLKSNGVDFSAPFEGHISFSNEHFYMPSNE